MLNFGEVFSPITRRRTNAGQVGEESEEPDGMKEDWSPASRCLIRFRHVFEVPIPRLDASQWFLTFYKQSA